MKNKRLFLWIFLCFSLTFQMQAKEWTVTDVAGFNDAWTNYADGDIITLASGTYDLSGSTRSISKTVTVKASTSATTKPVIKVQFNYTGNASFYMEGIEAYYDLEGASSTSGAYLIDTRNSGSYTIGTISFTNCKIHGYGRDLIRADNATNIPTISNIIMDNCVVYDMGRNSAGYPIFGVKYGKISNATITNSTFYNSMNGLWYSQVTTTPVTFRMERCTLLKMTSSGSTNLISASTNPGSSYTIKDCIISDSYDATTTNMKLTLGTNASTDLGYLINTILANNFVSGAKVGGTLTTNTEVLTTALSFDYPTLKIQTPPNTISAIGDPRWTLNPAIAQPAYLTTTVFPAGSGSITSSPNNSVYTVGDNVILTANRNFGYQFKEWRDANTDALVSTANPYTLTLNSDVSLKAVFNAINTYSLALNTQGGAPTYMISVSPAGTTVNGQTMYEEGTNVTLTPSSNTILTFTNWSTGETSPTLTVPMTQNQNITAVYSAVDYIAGWDFFKSGSSGRLADFYSTPDNQIAALTLRKADGTVNSWLDKSIAAAGGYTNRGAAVNWKPVADQYYYQISFSAKDFTDINVTAGLLYNYNAYTVQNCQYSLDGTNFTTLGTYTMPGSNTWYDNTFALPADANHADKVYVRWIPDYTSALNGSNAPSTDGTAISNIYITAKAAVYNDGIAPVLSSSIPASSSTGASATGKVVLTFDEKIMLTTSTVVGNMGDKQLTAAVSGKTITFPYSGLNYNTSYTFTLPAGSVSDLAGNTLTNPITINFTTMSRPLVAKKTFDFVVGVDGDFKTAIQAATAVSSTGERFRIFFPNGQYDIGGNTGNSNQMTTITLPNVSYIGQSANGVTLYNKPTVEGIGVTATMQFTNAANNLYMQDITLLNKMEYQTGTFGNRCVALWDQGTKNIYKNVNLLSNQDTYFSGSGRLYFEGGSLHGTVDFICGGGDVFFNECLLYLEERAGNVIAAPSTSSTWGYVFSNCTIDGAAINNKSYNLGRPWQNSPKAIYINTKMNILPTDAGWTEMGVVPGLFAEYNSTTSGGTTVDLSLRKSSYTYNGVTTTAPSPVLTSEQAAQYTIDNILGGSDAWQPKLYTDQAAAPVINGNGTTINWNDNNYVLCWAVFKDDVFVEFVTTNSYTIPSSASSGIYTIRAANEMGGLSPISNPYTYNSISTSIDNISKQSIIINQIFYSLDGRKITDVADFKGVLIVISIYSDGHVTTSKIMNPAK